MIPKWSKKLQSWSGLLDRRAFLALQLGVKNEIRCNEYLYLIIGNEEKRKISNGFNTKCSTVPNVRPTKVSPS